MTSTENVSPIFIFSIQRSGSTLLQRILAVHEEISTTSETFLLLPFFYSLKSKGVFSEYSHDYTAGAIRDFCLWLPNGVKGYHEEIRELAVRLYSKASKPGGKYFLDKTPSYHFIVEDILTLFPEAKFIFLWRHPLSVAASFLISPRFVKGRWVMYFYHQHINQGLTRLVEAYQNHASHVHCLKYEDLILEPDETLQNVFDYLELPYPPGLKTSFTQLRLRGGDQIGYNYKTLSKEPLQKWKGVMVNPLRKAWCRRYLRYIGNTRLKVMGYDLDSIMNEIDEIRPSIRYLGSDIVRMMLSGPVSLLFQRTIMGHNLRSLRTGKPLIMLQ